MTPRVRLTVVAFIAAQAVFAPEGRAQESGGGPEGRYSPVAPVLLHARLGVAAVVPDVLMRPEVQRWLLEGAESPDGPFGSERVEVDFGTDPVAGVEGGPSESAHSVGRAAEETRSEHFGTVGVVSLRRLCTGIGTATSPGPPLACDAPGPSPVLVRVEAF